MKIRMLKTGNGSIDGIKVTSYEAGKEYDLTRTAGERDLAAAFVGARMAEQVADEPVRQVLHAPVRLDPDPFVEETATPAPEENKAIPAAPENKIVQPAETKKPGKRK